MNSSWCDTSTRFCQSTGSGLSLTENTEYLLLAIPFLDVVTIRWHPLKPLDIMCRGHHQNFDFSHVSIEFMTSNPSLPLDDLCYHRPPPLTPCQYKLGHVYLALLSIGKGIHLILVYHHLFPSIGLFNLSCDITYLSSDNCLLM